MLNNTYAIDSDSAFGEQHYDRKSDASVVDDELVSPYISYKKQLDQVEEKFFCLRHSTKGQPWCWVDPRMSEAPHITLCFHDIQLLAQHLYHHPESLTNTSLPDTRHFNELRKTRVAAMLTRTPTEIINDKSNYGSSTAQRLVEQHDQSQIEAVLCELHRNYPALEYPQYNVLLQSLGVERLADALSLDVQFYRAVVGMDLGAAYIFCNYVSDAMRGAEVI